MKAETKISVFGMGKLGCTMLACFAHKGAQVIGVDINEDSVSKLNKGLSPIYEPGVAELIKKNISKISATSDAKKAVLNSSVSFIIVPTPSEKNGSFNTKAVESVATEIGKALSQKTEYHLVIVTSTVLPGDTTRIVGVLEKTSGKKCNVDFGVCYNPDFIALGTVVRDFLNPDMVLIGESDKKAGDTLCEIHENLVDNKPSINRMSFENAELTKIALNSYCTLKITFANIIAEICEKIPGGNSTVVTTALGFDTRIGNKYLKGGLSYGGPCFPRDNKAFAWTAGQFGVLNTLAMKTDEVNDFHRTSRIPEKLLSILSEKKGTHIAVLGLTYKADTTLVEESAAISVIKTLAKNNIKISVYDPAGLPDAKIALKDCPNIFFSDNSKACLKDADLCFIAAPWKEFKELSKNDFVEQMKTPVIFDAWNLVNFESEKNIDYIQIGKH
ncbi:MAG TPA: nucleotide sugar dehydrogenase [Bacteroidia bacterium]|jgi:UDPglucose 6-dehydrogenase|nr:nucleotide sugar dehydrogenase [Bacteroidia bacterium]